MAVFQSEKKKLLMDVHAQQHRTFVNAIRVDDLSKSLDKLLSIEKHLFSLAVRLALSIFFKRVLTFMKLISHNDNTSSEMQSAQSHQSQIYTKFLMLKGCI